MAQVRELPATETAAAAPQQSVNANTSSGLADRVQRVMLQPAASTAEPLRVSYETILGSALAYQRDVWKRTILSRDTLRQRADNMLAQSAAESRH